MAGGTVFSRRLSAIFRPHGPLYLRRLQAILAAVVLVLPLGCSEAGPGLWPFPPEEFQSEFDKLVDLKTCIDAARERGCRKPLAESGIDVEGYRTDLAGHLERRDYENAKAIYSGMSIEVRQYQAKARHPGCSLVAEG